MKPALRVFEELKSMIKIIMSGLGYVTMLRTLLVTTIRKSPTAWTSHTHRPMRVQRLNSTEISFNLVYHRLHRSPVFIVGVDNRFSTLIQIGKPNHF
ncbi:hypothetical protein RRG08_042743 [Elysia crispata]|uniref:Uncharacterized protein n=1 Tax=Elysia crispata TaxID=231223 RepID=A0AAE1CK48_9GAST|nr:hypothetical protein RRG08_042743 [Elysia crispata]